ncbi:MAG TPA: HAD family hydrolase [Bacillota bacterium]|jgi:putative hydrolase of the HAD superfamily|nr:HAD family hydrolase [Bacillota bacterium]HOL10509.1 HAD family hydrolase [Bacillota bacterium]HPO97837.1 HAD family hydrolase [Bacillota bacterium]
MILVFDLDDTLYDELTYVQSGFKAVAGFLEQTAKIPAENGFHLMWQQLESEGRGAVFDRLLQQYGIYSKGLVRRCLMVYRTHQPMLKLFPAAAACLDRFNEYPKYLVTDGNKLVQQRKIEALGIKHLFKHCYITHRYGIKNAKPSPYCFLKICERERLNPAQVVYIADNPQKDFVGIKPLGFKTIRLMQGQYRGLELAKDYEAEWRIGSLSDLTHDLLQRIFAG